MAGVGFRMNGNLPTRRLRFEARCRDAQYKPFVTKSRGWLILQVLIVNCVVFAGDSAWFRIPNECP